MTAFVVGRDSHVNKFRGRVGIAEGNDGDVNVGSFFDSLGVGAWVGDNDEPGFFEGAGDVVGEIARGEPTSNGDGTRVGGKLENGTLTVGAGRDDGDIGRVVDSCDDAGCQDNLFPSHREFKVSISDRQRPVGLW